jgi:hypothetical protein
LSALLFELLLLLLFVLSSFGIVILQVFHKFHPLQDVHDFLKYIPLLHTSSELLQVVVITQPQPPPHHHPEFIFVQVYQSILYQVLHVGVLGISLLTALIVHNSHLKS